MVIDDVTGMSLDDLSFSDGECSRTIGSCDFESGTCGWLQADASSLPTDAFDFVQRTSQDLTEMGLGTGPDADHSTGNAEGHFLVIEPLSGMEPPEDTAILISPEVFLGSSPAYCVEFYTWCEGSCPVLKLNVVYPNASVVIEELLTINDWHGREWIQYLTDVDTNITHKLTLVGSLNHAEEPLSIDDLSFKPGACPPPDGQFDCGVPGETVDPDQVCNFVEDCSNGKDEEGCGNCNFDLETGRIECVVKRLFELGLSYAITGECGYVSTTETDQKWTRRQPNLALCDQGLCSDHTEDNGYNYFLILEPNPEGTSSDLAEYAGPTVRETFSTCAFVYWQACA